MSNVDAMKAQLAVRLAGMQGAKGKKTMRRSAIDSSDDNASSDSEGTD